MDAGKFRRIPVWMGVRVDAVSRHDTGNVLYYIIPRVYKYEYSRFLG